MKYILALDSDRLLAPFLIDARLDRDREFDICLNDTVFATVNLDASTGNKFFDVDYPIAQAVIENIQNGILNVKFTAHQGSLAGGIYHIRLLK